MREDEKEATTAATLLERIHAQIDAEGGISIADYMQHALSDPQHGYYTTKNPLGAQGDFVTAPEISQIFGEMLGIWLAETWRLLGKPQATLAEFGPGLGTLMQDVLRATRHVPEFHEALEICMVETSPHLRAQQQQRLEEMHPRITWHNRLPPQEKPLLAFGNEFFDALPVYQYVTTAKGFRERIVLRAAEGDGLDFDVADYEERKLPFAYPRIAAGALPEGEIIETCPLAQDIMRELAAHITRYGGAALFVDYGYLRPQGNLAYASGDTLQALKNHKFHEVLENPGNADLTTHVDFTVLSQVAVAEGAYTPPVLTQRDFLLRMGGAQRMERLCANAGSPQEEEVIARGFHRLVADEEMGDMFKVLAVVPAGIPVPAFDTTLQEDL